MENGTCSCYCFSGRLEPFVEFYRETAHLVSFDFSTSSTITIGLGKAFIHLHWDHKSDLSLIEEEFDKALT